jgi:thymidine phosphorylase
MSKKVCDKCQSLYPDFGYCMPCFLETTDDNASLKSQLAKLEEQLRVARSALITYASHRLTRLNYDYPTDAQRTLDALKAIEGEK